MSQGRKNCQINVDLDFPSGWSFALNSLEVKGGLHLDRNVVATQTSSYYYAGSLGTARLSTNMYGPAHRDYVMQDTLGSNALVWSPCGAQRSLNLNVQVRVDNSRNRNGRGLISVDSIDALHTHDYGLIWRRCGR